MQRLSERKIVLVTRATRIDELVARFNTQSQARFYIESLGDDYADYQLEHDRYQTALKRCTIALAAAGRLHRIDRSFLPNFVFGKDDLVVVLGQDGLVANTLKYLDSHPVVGVNPEPARWDGVLLPFSPDDLRSALPEIVQNRRPHREVTMAEAKLNTGDHLFAVNDFFVGPRSHISARYLIRSGNRSEEQSSSGIIVSTGLGSTGWFKSLLAGAAGISASLAGTNPDPAPVADFSWESDHLFFTVREPFPSKSSQADIVFGKITRSSPLKLTSRMAGHGVIFSDGIEKDFSSFNSGTEATLSVAHTTGQIIQ